MFALSITLANVKGGFDISLFVNHFSIFQFQGPAYLSCNSEWDRSYCHTVTSLRGTPGHTKISKKHIN